ncbi:MAG: S-layer homology domain-containing protein [Oscillospiraceae bacterium]|nr:S-layer homology domain-containing protein [Oscillospiraceae bacterium]
MKLTKKQLLCAVLALAMCLSALPVQAALGDSPNAPATREMISTALWEMDGAPVVNYALPFTDVSQDADYAEAVRWAASERIVSGTGSSSFEPEGAVNREQLATMLYRYAGHIGLDVSVGEDTNILSYTDATAWSDWAVEALQWAVGSGLLKDQNGRLNAWGAVTQAEAAELLRRLSLMAVPSDPGTVSSADPLSMWTDTAPTKLALTEYMAAITDRSSRDYIPVEDRIAVFDFDGTLFCETDPNYFDYTLLAYRVLDDPDYRDRASDFEKEVANKIREQNEKGTSFEGLPVDHGKAVASAFAGMTLAEFDAYIQEFKKQPMPSYEGMLRGDGWYLPMLQIVDYLKANDFDVYIVSGTDRLIVRGIAFNSPIDLPNSRIIGSDESLVATGQGDVDGLDYTFVNGDEVITGGEFIIKNLKMNKVSAIVKEIGQQPVLSFGNSTGDSAMAGYVTSGNPYRSLAFMLCCDDLVRENGSESKAQKMYDVCEANDWIAVSMKNDWTTIYGDSVTYTG